MIVGVSHIAKTSDRIPEGYAFCETISNNPLKFPFMSRPHETHKIAFYRGSPSIEIVTYPLPIKPVGYLDSLGSSMVALLSTNIAKDAEQFSDCFTTGSFQVVVNKRSLLIQIFRANGGEFIELVQPHD
jgi:hypothetical protein